MQTRRRSYVRLAGCGNGKMMTKSLSKSIWNDVLEHVRLHAPHLARTWFSDLDPAELSGGVLMITAANAPRVRYLNEHCRRTFAEAAQAATGRLISVRFECDDNTEDTDVLSFDNDGSLLKLSDDYLFGNFITGPCNRLAHAAALAVAESPGKAYNPLFIHGDVGLGKTHLLQAVCHEFKHRQANTNIVYISCETFTNHFIEAVERGALHQFRYRYRHADCLVIDDIQFLAERERSQEEFFHTFNTLYQSQRQIILSADCSPAEIPSLEERLVSRFNSGLVALVDRPCLETRMAIVLAKTKLRCIDVPDNVIKAIATHIDSNVRELEGTLAKLTLLSQTQGGRIDIDLAMEALGITGPKPLVSIPEILNNVSKRHNLRLSDLQGKKRTKSIAFPRQVCMYLAREMTNLSLEEIGGYFGGRDHTTVLHAHRTISKRRQENPVFELELQNLQTTLRNGS